MNPPHAKNQSDMGISENIPIWEGYQGNIPLIDNCEVSRGAVVTLVESLYKLPSARRGTIGHKRWLDEKKNTRMSLENLTIQGCLNSGQFGVTWKALLDGSHPVAVRQKNPYQCTSEQIWMERDCLVYLKSPKSQHVINIIGSFFESNAFMVFELCFCRLSEAISSLSDPVKRKFVIQLLKGLEFIHSKEIWHCSITPDNLMITSRNNLVLSEFETAVFAPGLTKLKKTSSPAVFWYTDYEANLNNVYGSQTDIWAAGCCIYELSEAKCLMKYFNRSDVLQEEYAYVACWGKYDRKVNNQVYRTSLDKTYVASPFWPILTDMLTSYWGTRLSAKEILQSYKLARLYKPWNIDINNCKLAETDKIEAKSVNPALPLPFQLFQYPDPLGLTALEYSQLYYDDKLTRKEPKTKAAVKPILTSPSGMDYLNYLKANGLLETFVNSVSANDPIAVAACTFVVEKSIGLKSQPEARLPASDIETHQTMTTVSVYQKNPISLKPDLLKPKSSDKYPQFTQNKLTPLEEKKEMNRLINRMYDEDVAPRLSRPGEKFGQQLGPQSIRNKSGLLASATTLLPTVTLSSTKTHLSKMTAAKQQLPETQDDGRIVKPGTKLTNEVYEKIRQNVQDTVKKYKQKAQEKSQAGNQLRQTNGTEQPPTAVVESPSSKTKQNRSNKSKHHQPTDGENPRSESCSKTKRRKNTTNSTMTQPMEVYQCCNHDRGCVFTGDRESVVEHIKICSLNSSSSSGSSGSDTDTN